MSFKSKSVATTSSASGARLTHLSAERRLHVEACLLLHLERKAHISMFSMQACFSYHVSILSAIQLGSTRSLSQELTATWVLRLANWSAILFFSFSEHHVYVQFLLKREVRGGWIEACAQKQAGFMKYVTNVRYVICTVKHIKTFCHLWLDDVI